MTPNENELIHKMTMLLAYINRVTVYHRHLKSVPTKELDTLCNIQIDYENYLEKIKEELK